MVDESVHHRGGPLLRAVASRIGDHAPDPVLVHGSPPTIGRDLDLLVRADTMTSLTAALPRLGFELHGDDWILVEGLGAVAVSLTPADEWRLRPEVLDDLFASAIPLGEHPGLVRPAPHHDLLVLARRLAGHPGPLRDRHRARIEAATRSDPAAWERAASEAPAWDGARALEALRAAVVSDGRISRRVALAVRSEALRTDGTGRVAALLRAAVSLRPRPLARVRDRRRSGAVVALSGIDGSGKSTQARLVAEALWALGHETVVEWSRITFESSLERIARPVKAVLRIGRTKGTPIEPAPTGSAPEPGPNGDRDTDARARSLRERSRLVGSVWAGIVATTNAWTLRRTTGRHLRAGRIVVRDRYVLDSVVQLEWAYANGRDLGWQAAIIRSLAPRPVAAFFLRVAPERAHGRKPEEFEIDELRRHSETYARHTEALGIEVVDGERAEPEVFAMVLRGTLSRLDARDRR